MYYHWSLSPQPVQKRSTTGSRLWLVGLLLVSGAAFAFPPISAAEVQALRPVRATGGMALYDLRATPASALRSVALMDRSGCRDLRVGALRRARRTRALVRVAYTTRASSPRRSCPAQRRAILRDASIHRLHASRLIARHRLKPRRPALQLVVDTRAPTSPGGLAGRATDRSAGLTWAHSVDDFAIRGYRVHLQQPDGTWAVVGRTAGRRTAWAQARLRNYSVYRYRVTASDSAGNESAPSATVTVIPLPPRVRPVPFRGAHVHPFWTNSDRSAWQRELDLVRLAGANVVRVDIGWATLQPRGRSSWSRSYTAKIDAFMVDARARGLEVAVTVWSTPCWASSAPAEVKQGCSGAWWDRDVHKYPPEDAHAYASAVRWITRRWGADMVAVQIWNEPNLQDFWISANPAADYVRLVRAAYKAVKGGRHPFLPVVAGELSRSDGKFLQALYLEGIKGYFDLFSVHPYTGAESPYERRIGDARRHSFIDGVPWIRDVMLANGDDKQLWLSEFGYSSCTDAANESCVSQTVQAERSAQAWDILSGWDYVIGATQYSLRDASGHPGSTAGNMGLFTRGFELKQAFGAFEAAARR